MSTPRRWFRIHLSTAVVLMFVAGGLMWVNVRAVYHPAPTKAVAPYFARGWPMEAYYGRTENLTDDDYFNTNVAYLLPFTREHWNLVSLAVNLGIALAILVAVASGAEFVARLRGKAPKP